MLRFGQIRRTAAAFRSAGVTLAAALCIAITAHAEEPPSIETIRERFPDGNVKVEREVTTNPAGDYVNHGAWRMWNSAGVLVAEGRYDMGLPVGPWMCLVEREDAPLLAEKPFSDFAAPFVSRATFTAGELDGEWTIVDANERIASRVSFKRGKRHGIAVLYLPSGEITRDASFRNGLPVGKLRERDSNGQLQTVATYVNGQQIVNKSLCFPGTDVKQIEATYLTATIVEVAPDDYWQTRFAEYDTQGEEQRHGLWKSWYSNGQVQLEGYFQFDGETGTFTWWHANGAQAVRGNYVDGLADGAWTWWYANGQKAACGQYRYGVESGTWWQWAEDGKLVRCEECSNSSDIEARQKPVAAACKAEIAETAGAAKTTSAANR